MKKTVHLVANAHIDPIWQWGAEEGISASLATFRSAANLLEKNEDFIFAHNESLLYRWTEEFEPELFKRIQKLVKEGRWHIMGGFEIQPDCVMPNGESMIRQILTGQTYFKEKFDINPQIAYSGDAFGHSRGLVQILVKSGYLGYVFQRGDEPPKDFYWKGFDGSEIQCHKLLRGYGSSLGITCEQMQEWLERNEGKLEDVETYYWGVGNHGGGPSQRDITMFNEYKGANGEEGKPGFVFKHSTPDAYFKEAQERLPLDKTYDKSIGPIFVGCYTSVHEIKQIHRELEGALLNAERLAVAAEQNGVMEYPHDELNDAWRTLELLEFHDVLPGSHTRPAFEAMMKMSSHAIEICRRIMNKALFRLSAMEPVAAEGAIPFIAINPHPYPVKNIFECEYMLPDQNWDLDHWMSGEVYHDGKKIPSQIVREDSNIPLDWRKKMAFEAELKPFSVTRFDCRLVRVEGQKDSAEDRYEFDNGELYVRICPETGLIDELKVNGTAIGGKGLGAICVYNDCCDPWLMTSNKITDFAYELKLAEGTKVKVIEDGEVFTIVESQFAAEGIKATVRYRIPKKGKNIRLEVFLNNQLVEKMIRIKFPTASENATLIGDTMFGLEEKFMDGTENVSQRFDIAEWEGGSLGVINDCIYGGYFENGVLYKSLLRSPTYCGHWLGKERPILKYDRFNEYSGLGNYRYIFELIPATGDCRFETVREAQIINEPAFLVNHFPPGEEAKAKPFAINVEGEVSVTAIKKAEDGNGYIIRVFEPVGKAASYVVTWGDIRFEDTLNPFEIKAFRVNDGEFKPCDLIERNL
ncbi:MAG: alpha-mannosidase [Clostridiales bacterium]|nr:alpha-mannosidase [Clostridiales bacterium]